MSNLATIKVSSRGQIVIPRSIRDEIGLKEGDTSVIASRGNLLLLKKLTLEDIIAGTDRQYLAGETLSIEEAFKDLT